MLVSSFNLSQSFNYIPYLLKKKTVQTRDQFFLHMDLELWMYLLEECEDLRPVLCIAAQQVRNPANQPAGRKLSVEDYIIYNY
jgi:hypothetical protein